MVACALVVEAYTELRDALTGRAMRTSHPGDRNLLLHRAGVSGSLAEQCDGKFSGRDVPNGGAAVDQANAVKALADRTDHADHAANQAVIEEAEHANATLAAIVGRVAFGASLSDALVGSLRITPSRRALARAGGNFAAAASERPKPAVPSYITQVAMLFPVEAATLFPLGQSIAGNSPRMLLVVIVVTALFVIALRYFATQEDGKASWNEIGGALISLLLWIGATKGYWVTGEGLINLGINATEGAALFGFVTVMWVALAPYLVKEKARRDAAAEDLPK
ncbi:hypothetical protein [Sphingomonas sp. VNH70]|uniref:hypothetical protein n=1 Tax=Sphingomonas silueang TaxID=3156617 RepID=UPI0032B39CB2